jgi:hypothetical protein
MIRHVPSAPAKAHAVVSTTSSFDMTVWEARTSKPDDQQDRGTTNRLEWLHNTFWLTCGRARRPLTGAAGHNNQ